MEAAATRITHCASFRGRTIFNWRRRPGSNAEMASLKRFAPEYFATVRDWLVKRVP